MKFLIVLLCIMPVTPRVAFVGDSHMQALGPRMSRTFAVEGFEPVGVVARVGWGTNRYRRADDLEEVLRPMRPDIVVVVLGSNDYGIRRASSLAPRTLWIVAAARAAGARRVVWFGPPAGDPDASELAARVAENHDRIARMQREIFASSDVIWVDSRPFTRGHIRGDGFHLTARGYNIWARAAARTEGLR